MALAACLTGVHLVGCHADDRRDIALLPRRLKHVRGADHVGFERLDRLREGVRHQRLGSEVEDDARSRFLHHPLDGGEIANIADV